MLLQTNSYVVPREKRAEHARLLRRFRSTLAKLGCDQFEAYEQVGPNWNGNEATGRYVQIMRFRDRKHQIQVQQAERSSPAAQQVIADFCRLINFPYQQQQGLFAVGYYTAVLPDLSARAHSAPASAEPFGGMAAAAAAAAASAAPFGTSLQPAEEASAEEASAEEASVEAEGQVEEEAAATAVEYAEEPVEETYPAAEELAASSEEVAPATTLDEALDAADVAYKSIAAVEEPVETPPPAPIAEPRPAPAVVPPPTRAPAPVAPAEPRRGLRPRKPIASAPPPALPPAPPPAVARPREVWSDDYTAPQGTAAPQPIPAVEPARKPLSPAEAARGNGAATAPAFAPEPAELEVPGAPSAAEQLAAMLPDLEPIKEVEFPTAPVAPQAEAELDLDLVDEEADKQGFEAPATTEAPVVAEAPPVVAEAPRPVAPALPLVATAAPVSPPPLPVVREEHAPAVIEPASAASAPGKGLVEPRQQEAVPQPAAGDDELRVDEAPLAFEPELIPEEDEFSWPDELIEAAATPAAAQAEPVEEAEAAVHEHADAVPAELAGDEPLRIEPAVAEAPAPSVPVQPAEVIASQPEPEPLRFAGEQPAPAATTADVIVDPPAGSASDLGLLAAEHQNEAAGTDDPFESLADALEVSDDELDVQSDPPAAAQPPRMAGSNGNGALTVTSAAKKSAAAFTDEDIDAALNEALRQLDGLDDLSEAAAVPARGRAGAR